MSATLDPRTVVVDHDFEIKQVQKYTETAKPKKYWFNEFLDFDRIYGRDAALRYMCTDSDDETRPLLICWCIKEKGNAYFKEGNFEAAMSEYLDAMRAIIGHKETLPVKEFFNKKYVELFGPGTDYRIRLELVACSNNIAQCYTKLGNYMKALDWLQEVEVMYHCQHLSKGAGLTVWGRMISEILEDCTYRMKAASRFSEIFAILGNTSASSYFASQCMIVHPDLYPKLPEIKRLQDSCDYPTKVSWRHPEPSMIDTWEVKHPDLQVRGTWTKLSSNWENKPPSRMCFACWIWRSKLYVFGGRPQTKDITLTDLWCLDLKSQATLWRRLPDLPIDMFPNPQIQIWDNKAWLFLGQQEMYLFDLIKEEWLSVSTSMQDGSWPYPVNRAFVEYSVEQFEGNIYIFGGDTLPAFQGTNLFMMLDLATLKWRKLGGAHRDQSTISKYFPPPRRLATTWVVPNQKKIYLLFGTSSHARPDEPIHEQKTIHCDALWSYSIDKNKWKRERIRGNWPSPRTGPACAFNPTINRTVIYGGYNDTVDTIDTKFLGKYFDFTYYGDTYLFDPDTLLFAHVLTHEFPSYRASASCLVDEDTGKTYIYGGINARQFTSDRNKTQRQSLRNSFNHLEAGAKYFSDLWRLDVDVPQIRLNPADGTSTLGPPSFDEKLFEQDTKSLRIGPWKRCFCCMEVGAGTDYMKCGGTCGGVVYFCSKDCQRVAWVMHKEVHGCRKKPDEIQNAEGKGKKKEKRAE